MFKDDFKNFLIIKKIEDDKKGKDILSIIVCNKWKIIFSIIFIFILFFIYNIYFTKINLISRQNNENLFQINNGESVNYIGQRLYDEGIIKSSLAFKIYVKVFSGNTLAQAGIYNLEKDDSLISLANKIIKGDYAIPPVRITIPEGSNNIELAEIINKGFSNEIYAPQLIDDFSKKNILEKIKDKEGYLFPETYLFLPNVYLDQVINQLSNHFYNNLKNIFINERNELGIYALDLREFNINDYFNDDNKEINLKKRFTIINNVGTTTVTIKDIITMASFLEGEANNEEAMRKVSGILWNRLKLNYPLQIDAATSTYKEKGFTKSPINNPGNIAIRAAINPINTGDIFYITGNDGNMYYAKDYKTHLDNINKYLRNRSR